MTGLWDKQMRSFRTGNCHECVCFVCFLNDCILFSMLKWRARDWPLCSLSASNQLLKEINVLEIQFQIERSCRESAEALALKVCLLTTGLFFLSFPFLQHLNHQISIWSGFSPGDQREQSPEEKEPDVDATHRWTTWKPAWCDLWPCG